MEQRTERAQQRNGVGVTTPVTTRSVLATVVGLAMVVFASHECPTLRQSLSNVYEKMQLTAQYALLGCY